MSVINLNTGINYGHIGDRLYIYNNVQEATSMLKKVIVDDDGEDGEEFEGYQNILALMLFNQYSDEINDEFDKAMVGGIRYPMKIRVTKLVNDCAQGVYYNGGNMDRDVWKIVDAIVTLICALRCGVDFYAERVQVRDHIYYELYPQKK